MAFRYKKHLKGLVRTRAGTYRDVSEGLFLERNERIAPYDKTTLKLLSKRLMGSRFNLYPDVGPFYRRLADFFGVGEDMIYITEGVSGAIKSLFESLMEPGDNVIFPVPTFALYPVYCRMFDAEARTIGYGDDHRLDIKKTLSLLDKKTSILFLPNPNVPIEGGVDLKTIAYMADRCRKNGTFLAVDEVYFGFGGPTAVDLVKDFDNLFVMRSFSKAFGLAGIRVGYLIGAKKNIEYVSKMRTGYEANTLSMETASFFLDHYHIVEGHIEAVKDGLAYLKSELDTLGLEYTGGDTSNFIFVDLHDRALVERLTRDLLKKKIYIRSNWPEPYSNGFSVTGSPKAIMKIFVKELRRSLLKHKA